MSSPINLERPSAFRLTLRDGTRAIAIRAGGQMVICRYEHADTLLDDIDELMETKTNA